MKFLHKMCLSRTQVVVGFRVALRSNMTARKGICCSSLAELRQKVGKKFPESIEEGVYTTDDTLVDEDDFLLSLPPQSLLVVGSPLAQPQDAANVFDRLLRLLRETSGAAPVCREVLDFMQEDFETKWKQMRAKVEETDLVLASSRADHPAWFEDLSTNAKTKEEFMTKSCQARVRGYLAKAETQLRATVSKPGEVEQAEEVIREFKTRLRKNKFHGGYFDRGTDEATRICDESGETTWKVPPDHHSQGISSARGSTASPAAPTPRTTPSTPTRAPRPGSSSPRGTSTTWWSAAGRSCRRWPPPSRARRQGAASTSTTSTASSSRGSTSDWSTSSVTTRGLILAGHVIRTSTMPSDDVFH